LTKRLARLSAAFAVAATLLSLAPSAHAAWRVLAIVKADKGLDREEVTVRSGRGFKAIKLKVDGADVEIKSLHVVYGSGEPDKLDVRRVLRAGTETRAIALKGGTRIIRKVVLWFGTPSRESRKAIVTVFGDD
jgi:hypothetical protein